MAFDPSIMLESGKELLIAVGIFVAVILVGILLGYVIGAVIAAIVRRILSIRELKEQIASSEIISLSFWSKVTNGIGVYIKWLFVSIVLHYVIEGSIERGIWYSKLSQYTATFQSFMGGLGVFTLFAVVGIVVGAIVYKILKAGLDSIRVEEKMAKHGLHDALGGLQLTKVVAGIFMIYIVIVFLGSGVDAVATPLGQEANRLVIMFHSLIQLYPEFVLGGFIIIAGALIGDFMRDSINGSKASLASESVAWLVQSMTIFFAIVLALPHFQIKDNVDILTDSFKIIVAGISIGMAIAMGLGLKDTFGKWGKKVEKRI
jgi:hypothetical protein